VICLALVAALAFRGRAPLVSAGKAEILRAHAHLQQVILKLQSYWGDKGCALLQPYDMKWARARFTPPPFCAPSARSPGSSLRAALASAESGRYGDNPNRLQHYYQYQVVLKLLRRYQIST